ILVSPGLDSGVMDSSSAHPPPIPTELGAAVPTIFPRLGYSILSFLMFINTVLSVFNNGLVITVMLRNPSLLHPMNVFILSLAVSDIMVGLCGSLIVTITNYQGSFFLGHTACVFQGFAVNYFGLVSLCTLALLAYERYNVVCNPRDSLKLSMRRSIMGLSFVWVFCLFWAVTPLFGWSSYGPEGVQTSCSLAWEERSWSNYSYLILYTILCFIFPVVVIIYCYSKVLEGNDHAVSMVLAMITAFFVCWLPYTVLSVVVVLDPELYIPPLVATMPMYFAKTSPIYNPIIYFLTNKQVSSWSVYLCGHRRELPWLSVLLVLTEDTALHIYRPVSLRSSL
uniref:Parapinopsin-like n=1 Tax=Echeneis naucrates TaxID=173247 RepID=A0A665UVH3_ECHNA